MRYQRNKRTRREKEEKGEKFVFLRKEGFLLEYRIHAITPAQRMTMAIKTNKREQNPNRVPDRREDPSSVPSTFPFKSSTDTILKPFSSKRGTKFELKYS